MELQQLKYFSVIARYQNMSVAAKKLFVAQPALSQSMKNLEYDLGVKLFTRTGKSLRLSKCGEELQRRLEDILPQLDNLSTVLQEIEDRYSSIVTVYFPIGSYYIPMLLDNFSKQHPDVSLKLLRSVSFNEPCSMAVTTETPSGNLDGVTLIAHDKFYLMVPADSELAQQSSVDLRDLRERHFILPAAKREYSVRDSIDEIFRSAGYAPNVSIECGFSYLIPDLVKRGIGLSVLPKRTFSDDGVKYIPITEPDVSRSLYLVWNKNSEFTFGMTVFKEYMQDFFSELDQEI